MLKELYIENLAIIEKTAVAFDNRLNAFSGETGAGKSILIGGINAVLGNRVNKDAVRNGADKAVIQALFIGIPEKVLEKLSEFGYEVNDDELTLSREISADGKSVARINGRAATASVLKEVAAGLIDVHGQHETRLIVSNDNQLELIDDFGNCNVELSKYASKFREFSSLNKRIKALQSEAQFKNEKIDLLTKRLSELTPYKLKKGEEDEVSLALERARNVQVLAEALNKAHGAIAGSGEGAGALETLNFSKANLIEAGKYIPECENLKQRLEVLIIELDDIKREVSSLISDDGDLNEANNLSRLEERMSDFLRLKRKFNVAEIDELVQKIEDWKRELNELQGGEDFVEKLLEEKKRLGVEVKALAEALTKKRKETASKLSEMIKKELIYLDMPDVRLEFMITSENATVKGMDGAELLISVNKGEEMKPASKIASGGELSRIMLAIKSVLAESDDVPTMVFDEIDSGISGRAAHKVGVKLSQIATKRQVLCVTHLAQIAALADNHLLIEKTSQSGRTFTGVRKIEGEERKVELARIISGDDDEISLANAERLMERKTAN